MNFSTPPPIGSSFSAKLDAAATPAMGFGAVAPPAGGGFGFGAKLDPPALPAAVAPPAGGGFGFGAKLAPAAAPALPVRTSPAPPVRQRQDPGGIAPAWTQAVGGDENARRERDLVDGLKWAVSHKSAVVCLAASWLPEPYIQAGVKWLRREAAKLTDVRFVFVLLEGHAPELLPRLQIVLHHNLRVVGHADEAVVLRELLQSNADLVKQYPAVLLLKAGKVEQVVHGLRPEDIEGICNKARTAKVATGGIGAPAPGTTPAEALDGNALHRGPSARGGGKSAPLDIPEDIRLCRATVASLLTDAAAHAKELAGKVTAAAAQPPVAASAAEAGALAEQEKACVALVQGAEHARHDGAGQGRGSFARKIHEEGLQTSKDLAQALAALSRCEAHVKEGTRAGAATSISTSLDRLKATVVDKGEAPSRIKCSSWLEAELGAWSALTASAPPHGGAHPRTPSTDKEAKHRLSPLAWAMQSSPTTRSRTTSPAPPTPTPRSTAGDMLRTPPPPARGAARATASPGSPWTPHQVGGGSAGGSAGGGAWGGGWRGGRESPLDMHSLGAVLEGHGEAARLPSGIDSPGGLSATGSSWQVKQTPQSADSRRSARPGSSGSRAKTPMEEKQQAVRSILKQQALFGSRA